SQHGDVQIDVVEPADREVVTSDGGGSRETNRRPGGPEAHGSDVATVRPPDVPLVRETSAPAVLAGLRDRGVLGEISHDIASWHRGHEVDSEIVTPSISSISTRDVTA